jgi:hypothetical protein
MTHPATLRRLDALIWVLLFGGLLTLVLGLSITDLQAAWGGWVVAGGVLAVVLGLVLFVLRSRLTAEPEDVSRS